MGEAAPKRIRIEPDDHHARWVGRLSDGRQFFATTPFVPAIGGPGAELIAVYIWNASGDFLEARIDELGPRATLDDDRARKLYQERIRALGPFDASTSRSG